MFKLLKTSEKSAARLGVLHTAHGQIETPVFMPVGTQASVKGLWPEALNDIGSQIILGNTYHLHLRPTDQIIAQLGGLHRFMNWNKPILTDSGGYQVFSLSKSRKIDAKGVTFKSHINGAAVRFEPKTVIDIQKNLGSDIMMPLDICTAYPASKNQLESDLKITTQWELEAYHYWKSQHTQQHLFAIVQGGCDIGLRKQSAESLCPYNFSGFALGGLSVGEPQELLESVTHASTPFLPKDKPRYLMGVGLPKNMRAAIASGIDMFDCVAPTRLARHGHVFIAEGHLNLKNSRFKLDALPIEEHCSCYTCQNYSKAYLRHLLVAKEPLAISLLSLHNIYFMHQLVKSIKQEIKDGIF